MSKHLSENTQNQGSTSAREGLAKLEQWFLQFDSALIAFSSGVDSSVLASAAKRVLQERAIAVNSLSKSFSEEERTDAVKISKEIGIELLFVEQKDLEKEDYVKNNANRCYFCRTNLAAEIIPIAKKRKTSVCVDGTHKDDMKSPRPGVKALREHGFRAPYIELGFDKSMIRAIAKYIGLSNAEKPAEACLASRIAFGQRIDYSTLRRIENAERILRAILKPKIIRVRTIGNRAMIELDHESTSKAVRKFREIESALFSLGYASVEIDPDGYRTGRMLDLFVQSQ